ncbi:E3 ubiquitin-protein ligase rad18 [Dissophora ornata]|nr:E3 ubiquitin-protein ligase rad18 [Dissophora ornata]
MRRNVALDEIANCFKDCRSSLLKTVTDALKPKLKDNPQLSRAESMDIDDIAPQSKRRRTSSRISKKASSNSSSQELMDTSMGHHTLGDDDKDDDDKDDDFIISSQESTSILKGKNVARSTTGHMLRSKGGRSELTTMAIHESDPEQSTSPTVPSLARPIIPTTPTKPKTRTLVPCPVCQMGIPEAYTNTHLDTYCFKGQQDPAYTIPFDLIKTQTPEVIEIYERQGTTTRSVTKPAASSPLQRNSDASIINNTTIDGHSRSGSSPLHNRTKHMQISNSPVKQTYPEPKRIPKLTYSVLNDKQLRKKLQELGLPTHGDKQLMQKRHAEYVTIHNANCDATRPQTIAQLKKTMDVWERTYAQDLQAKDAQRRSLEEQQKRQQLELARRRAQEAQESATTSTHAAGTADASTGVDPAVDLMLNTVTLPSSQGSNHIDSGSGSGSTSSFVPNQANNNSVAVAVAEASAFAHALKYADEYAELMADVKRRQQADKEKQALADKKDPEKEQERERQDPQP